LGRSENAPVSVGDQPYVIEVNTSLGFKGLYQAAGINATEKIAEYALTKAKR
jgi:glutathione synthase/RimK-type ligase-like ATP-grasp enzyme